MKRRLLFLICMLLIMIAGCGRNINQTDAEADSPPALVLMKEGKEYPAILGSYRWGEKEVDMLWPPALYGIPAVVEQGDKLEFALAGSKEKPDGVKVKLVWENYFYYAEEPVGEELKVWELESSDITYQQDIPGFGLVFPQLDSNLYDTRYGLEIEVCWLEGKEEKRRAEYYTRLQVSSREAIDAVEVAATGLREAAWKGDKEEASRHLVGYILDQLDNPMNSYSSFATVAEFSGWGLLLWQDEDREFVRATQPTFDIVSIGPDMEGPYAETVSEYQVEVTRKGERQLWHFTEHYGLERIDGEWKIHRLQRNGKPLDSVTGAAGWKVSVDRESGMLRIGPFTWINLYEGDAAPGGDYAAFIGDNFGTEELWLGRISTGDFKKIFQLNSTDNPRGHIKILKVSDAGKAIFMVSGYMNTGPYEGRQGFWVLEGDLKAQGHRSLAFVPAGRADYFEASKIIQDERYLLIQKAARLYRVDLSDGAHRILREDMPDYLNPARYNEDGTLLAWEKQGPDGIYVVVYDPVDEKEAILKSPEKGLRMDLMGVYRDRVAVSLCRPENIQQGEDGDWPVGIERMLMYNAGGQAVDEITPPEAQYIGSISYDSKRGDLYYTTGVIEEQADPWMGNGAFKFLCSRRLYRRPMEGGNADLLLELDGHVNYVEDMAGGRVLWYRPEYDEDGIGVQQGLFLDDEGKAEMLARHFGDGDEYYLTQVGDTKYIRVFDREKGLGMIKKISKGGEQVLLSGDFDLYHCKVVGDAVMFATDPANLQPYPLKAYVYIDNN